MLGQQRIDVRRTHDYSIIYKSLMVALDRFEVVEVVHHDAERFLDAARCGVSEPVDPLQTCAISQMKAGDRISWLLGRGVARQIGCTKTHDQRLQGIIAFRCIEQPGTGDNVEKRVRCCSSFFNSSTTCLIRKLPKEIPRRPS